ncbi:hypothetical protein GGX14DRAFT_699167 [Mycena pura]|uniref:Uncharacterized protein n=1 Tax=Mycena pura TaxID=153505 RepID=A0AAD6V8G6_9AGAR|nr:hypothetical protein GGX14DRAFT_699167 [Mycena pura]
MRWKQSPFDTQELVDSIIWHIDHAPGKSKQDLLTCALVATLWTYPAQSCIFRELSLSGKDLGYRWPLLRRALGFAPYLVQHIRRLCFFGTMTTSLSDLFSDMCTFPFTHLEHADVSLPSIDSPMPVQNVLAVRQLFGLSTLRSVAIFWLGSSDDAELFHRLWELCSPSIKHLVLDLNLHGGSHPLPKFTPRRSQTPQAVIFLESLHIFSNVSFEHILDATPFSLEQLNKLSVASITEPILWHSIAPSLQSVQYLAFDVEFGQTTASVDLSLLPSLVVLCIYFNCEDNSAEGELKVLSGINAAHQIGTIILILETNMFESSVCKKLDAKLSSLPMRQPPIVVLDTNAENYSHWRQHMPTLRSSNLGGRGLEVSLLQATFCLAVCPLVGGMKKGKHIDNTIHSRTRWVVPRWRSSRALPAGRMLNVAPFEHVVAHGAGTSREEALNADVQEGSSLGGGIVVEDAGNAIRARNILLTSYHSVAVASAGQVPRRASTRLLPSTSEATSGLFSHPTPSFRTADFSATFVTFVLTLISTRFLTLRLGDLVTAPFRELNLPPILLFWTTDLFPDPNLRQSPLPQRLSACPARSKYGASRAGFARMSALSGRIGAAVAESRAHAVESSLSAFTSSHASSAGLAVP